MCSWSKSDVSLLVGWLNVGFMMSNLLVSFALCDVLHEPISHKIENSSLIITMGKGPSHVSKSASYGC